MLKIFGIIGQNFNVPDNLPKFVKKFSSCFYSIFVSGIYDENKCVLDDKRFTMIISGYLNGDDIVPFKQIKLLYKKHSYSNFCKYLNGSFNLVIIDKINETICICSDKYASRPLFISREREQFVFGSEIKLLYPFMKNELATNWDAWGQYLTYRFLIGDNTLHKDIDFLSNATQILFTLNKKGLKITRQKYWDYSEIKIDKKTSFADKVEEGVGLFRTIFKELGSRVENDKTLIALSGGYDSRSIVAGLINYSKATFDTVTTMHPCGDETSIVRKLTMKLKLSSKFVDRPIDLYRRFFTHKAELCDHLTQEHIWIMPLLEMSMYYNNYIDGMAGDIVMRSTRVRPIHVTKHNDIQLLVKLFKKQFGFDYKWLSHYIDPKTWQDIKYNEKWSTDEFKSIKNDENRMVVFLMRNRIKNGIAVVPSNIIGGSYKNVYTPFIDDRIINFGLSIPHKYKFKYIYRTIIDKAFPKIKDIISTSDEDTQKLRQYDARIMQFELNPRELISDYNEISKEDVKYLFELLSVIELPPFINKIKFMNDMKNYPQTHKLVTILDMALWFKSLSI